MAVSTLFDGTDDRITSTTGTDLTLGAYTWGTLLHVEALTGIDTWFSLDDAATSRFSPYLTGTTLGVEHAVGTSSELTAAFADWGGWRAIFITKATGTVAPRAHVYNGVSWVHTNMATAIGNPNGAQSTLMIGAYATGGPSDFSDGECAWMGLWGEDTAVDGTVESYLDYATLSSKTNAEFFTGTSLLNGGTMNDISVRNNDETARTGATTGVRHLPGWMSNFHTRALPYVLRSNSFVGTTGNPTYAAPSGATTGDLIIVNGVLDSTVAASASTGWTQIYNTTVSTTNRFLTYARVLDGGANDSLVITLTANTNDFAFQSHRIPTGSHGVTNPATQIEVGTAATGTSATPDPPNCTWSSGDRYVMCFFGADDDDTSNLFMPASYAGLRQTISATGTSSCMTSSAYTEITGTTSANPGTFTMAASEEWVAGTIAIPAGGAPANRPWMRGPQRRQGLWVPRGGSRSGRSR